MRAHQQKDINREVSPAFFLQNRTEGHKNWGKFFKLQPIFNFTTGVQRHSNVVSLH